MPATFVHTVHRDLPPRDFVVPDPYEQFYNSGHIPDDLVVSMESSAIRSIVPVVDNQQQVESIVDGGSQIIAMSESICHELGLPYDPCIVLKMQSANGSVGFSGRPLIIDFDRASLDHSCSPSCKELLQVAQALGLGAAADVGGGEMQAHGAQ
ncbi:hypothetical protein B0H11DRAFT_2373530 [Mycena galericulata]|nr:hypothetical protein B0H11DRAFT_2373530 [Mycena galericulata]